MKYSQTPLLRGPIRAINRAFESRRRTTVWSITAWLRNVALATGAILLPVGPAAMASVFTLTNTTLPGIAYGAVTCADFANDGKPDVLVMGLGVSFTPICQVWHNQTNGVFTNLNVALPGGASSAIARGDLYNEGRADFLCTGYAGVNSNNFPVYLSQIWHNLGNGTFTNAQAGLPGVDTGAVTLGDFDNDGNLDMLLTGYSATGAVAQVWRNLATVPSPTSTPVCRASSTVPWLWATTIMTASWTSGAYRQTRRALRGESGRPSGITPAARLCAGLKPRRICLGAHEEEWRLQEAIETE